MLPLDPRRRPTDVPRGAAAARIARRAVIVAGIGLGALGGASRGSEGALPGSNLESFDAGERARILALGPWPPVIAPVSPASDASAALIAFGEALFHSARLGGG